MPFTLTASAPNDSMLRVGTIPGSSAIKPARLPLIAGRLTISGLLMLPPTCFDVRSTSGVSAMTVNSSATLPISS